LFALAVMSGGRRTAQYARALVDHAEAILASGAAQHAASNRPLPGAVPALLLYDRYFSGEIPGR